MTPIRVPVASLAAFQEIMLSEGWKGKAPILIGTTVQIGNVIFEYEPRSCPVEPPPPPSTVGELYVIGGKFYVLGGRTLWEVAVKSLTPAPAS